MRLVAGCCLRQTDYNLIELSSVEGRVLEVRGINGTLRVDLTDEELEAMLSMVRAKLA